MTQLDHLRIKGFKCINQMEVDPKQLNIITGRNNSGKTSLLESIDIAFNPSNIMRFGKLANHIINKENEICSISVDYTEAQTKIEDFAKSNSQGDRREIAFREPLENEAIELFQRTLMDILDLNEKYPLAPLPMERVSEEVPEEDELEDYNELMRDILREEASNLSPEELLRSGVQDNIVIMEIDGVEYAFIHLGDYYDNLRNYVIENSVDQLEQKVNTPFIEEGMISREYLHDTYNRLLTPRFGRNRFIGESPPHIEGINFLDEVKGNRTQFDLEQENTAIRTNKIESYLKENNIIENLLDFSFDTIVVQGEEKPYEVPYQFLGGGTKITIQVLWELFNEDQRGDVLLLEEPENHMHPGYIETLTRNLISISKQRGIQLFITTHNVDFINSFFSPGIQKESRDYLEKEFNLIQLTDPVHKEMSYGQAQKKIEDLDLDLRGV